MGKHLKLYNTLSQGEQEFHPLSEGKVKMYVCGPTVYDDAHLGHARCYITWDVVFRFLTFLGYDVTYVRNVTDVDDKILNRAKDLGMTPEAVAEKNYESFQADMQALNVLPPTHEPRATHYIRQMIEAITVLIDKGAAYPTPDGTVYYRTASKADYGKLSKKPLDDLQAGARVEVDPHKESPLDFALWKGVADANETGWDAPWGRGRPGWHIECSAMSRSLLGDQLDIHAGGADLIFPHHENEIAQSEAWTGHTPFVKYWLHNGFVNVSGEKMSKSLGNFATIKTMLARYDANTLRYFLLTHHYRMPVDFNDEALQGAENRTVKIHRTLKEAVELLGLGKAEISQLAEPASQKHPEAATLLEKFREAMQSDFNTPQALAVLNELMGHLNLTDPDSLKSRLAAVLEVFGILGFSTESLFEKPQLPADELRTIYNELTGQWLEPDRDPEACLNEIIELRKTAKATKNWPQADAIRKHMTDIGILLKDNKDGTTTWELAPRHDRQPVT